ncbi:hypothetical protein HZH68_012546 [Vespula germanica]|uniref:Uncharacterized protein n=1 Tax=Vespula germanica TaxID=30212 RepID=A0A834JKB9_VESGE|nr:hypothetical protein HZH68_012546 [Vespula germanica]
MQQRKRHSIITAFTLTHSVTVIEAKQSGKRIVQERRKEEEEEEEEEERKERRNSGTNSKRDVKPPTPRVMTSLSDNKVQHVQQRGKVLPRIVRRNKVLGKLRWTVRNP